MIDDDTTVNACSDVPTETLTAFTDFIRLIGHKTSPQEKRSGLTELIYGQSGGQQDTVKPLKPHPIAFACRTCNKID